MKKTILISLLFLTFLNGNIAQTQSKKGNNIQFSVGPIISYHSGTINLGNGNNRALRGLNLSKFNSIGGGVLADFKFKKQLFLQTGLVYDTRTVTDTEFVSIDSDPFASNFSLQIAHLSIPLIVGYTFGKGNTQPYISAGFQIGTGIKEEVSNIYEEELPSYIQKNEPVFEFNSAEYGILGEIGIRQYIGKFSIVNLGVQYMGGDRDTFVNRTNNLTGGAVNLGTKRLAINLSYLFRL